MLIHFTQSRRFLCYWGNHSLGTECSSPGLGREGALSWEKWGTRGRKVVCIWKVVCSSALQSWWLESAQRAAPCRCPTAGMSGLEIQYVPIISDPVGYGWRVNINSWSYFGQDFVNEKVTDVKCHLLIYTNVCFSDSGAENPAGSGSEPKCLYTGVMFHRATDTSGKM